MIQNFSLIYGIPADSEKVFKKAMPVSVLNGVITPYTAANSNYAGVLCEDDEPSGVSMQSYGKNIISVGTTGFGQVAAGGAVSAGDMLEPSETGYIKTTDASKSVGKALTSAVSQGEYIKAVLYKI